MESVCMCDTTNEVNKAEPQISRLSHALFVDIAVVVVFIPLHEFHLCIFSILKYGDDDDFYRKNKNE